MQNDPTKTSYPLREMPKECQEILDQNDNIKSFRTFTVVVHDISEPENLMNLLLPDEMTEEEYPIYIDIFSSYNHFEADVLLVEEFVPQKTGQRTVVVRERFEEPEIKIFDISELKPVPIPVIDRDYGVWIKADYYPQMVEDLTKEEAFEFRDQCTDIAYVVKILY